MAKSYAVSQSQFGRPHGVLPCGQFPRPRSMRISKCSEYSTNATIETCSIEISPPLNLEPNTNLTLFPQWLMDDGRLNI